LEIENKVLNPEEYVLLEVGVSLVAKRLGNFHCCMSCMSRVGDSHWHTLRSDCGHHHIQNSSPISYVKEHDRSVRTKLQPDGFSQAQIQIFRRPPRVFPPKGWRGHWLACNVVGVARWCSDPVCTGKSTGKWYINIQQQKGDILRVFPENNSESLKKKKGKHIYMWA
jgi:hypothetical protein